VDDARLYELLEGRFIATLATSNADGSIHLSAVWFLHDQAGAEPFAALQRAV
jgi:hypothetical protein